MIFLVLFFLNSVFHVMPSGSRIIKLFQLFQQVLTSVILAELLYLTLMSQAKELLPLEGSKSEIWKHFGFPAKDGKFVQPDKKIRKEVFCRICYKPLKYCGNTTNLHYHLKEHHHSVHLSLASKANKDKEKVQLDHQPTIPAAVAAAGIVVPLQWWKSYQGRYPLLSQLAKHYLSIPATSVPCKRVFSRAGHVVNAKRSCLLPSNVNMLVFLAENLKVIFNILTFFNVVFFKALATFVEFAYYNL